MADKTPDATADSPKVKGEKGNTLKAMILIGLVLFIEAGAIFATIWFSGGPAEAEGAGGISAELEAQGNQLVEVLVLADKFTNMRTGRTYYYETEIHATVKNRNLDKFKEELESMQARLRNEVDTIFRQAEPTHFQEPTRATLTRQIKSVLDERFGRDTQDEPIVQQVLLSKCNPYRADY